MQGKKGSIAKCCVTILSNTKNHEETEVVAQQLCSSAPPVSSVGPMPYCPLWKGRILLVTSYNSPHVMYSLVLADCIIQAFKGCIAGIPYPTACGVVHSVLSTTSSGGDHLGPG